MEISNYNSKTISVWIIVECFYFQQYFVLNYRSDWNLTVTVVTKLNTFVLVAKIIFKTKIL